MTARRSEDAQGVLIDAAERAASRGHCLRAVRLLGDCDRLGPMTEEHRARWDALMERIDPLDQRPAA